MTMESGDFVLERKGECLLLRFTRPENHNAITLAVIEALEACCDELDGGNGRTLVVTGEGERAFSSGTDLEESAALGAEPSRAKTKRAQDLYLRIHRSPWTSIAAVNGLAYGGGMELALACTFRVACPGARMALPEIKIGVLPAYGGTQFLPAMVGRARALDLMLTGRAVHVEEAVRLGLLDRVAADRDSLLDEAFALADSVLRHSQFAIDRIRRCVDAAGAEISEDGMAVENRAFEEVMVSEDAAEGVTAFFEKRKANFKHR